MKYSNQILNTVIAVTLFGVRALFAEGAHNHAAEKAPHNGRWMETEKVGALHVEFLVEPDKTVSVYLYDGKLKPVAPSNQSLSMIVQGQDDAKNKVDLLKKDDRFVSSSPLAIPEGAKAVLTIRADGKTENLRFPLDMAVCGDCKNPEYACSCSHH